MLHFTLWAEDFHFLETAMGEHLRPGNGHGHLRGRRGLSSLRRLRSLHRPVTESRKQNQHEGYDARTATHYRNSLVGVAAATGCMDVFRVTTERISLVLQYEN